MPLEDIQHRFHASFTDCKILCLNEFRHTAKINSFDFKIENFNSRLSFNELKFYFQSDNLSFSNDNVWLKINSS